MITTDHYNKLNEISVMQSKLDESILQKHDCSFDLEKSKLALIDELGEMNHENKGNWCWWKSTQAPVDRNKLLEELVDAWHFAMSIYNHVRKGSDIRADVQSFEVVKYESFDLSTLIAWAITKDVVLIPIMIAISNKLGFTIEDVYQAYIEKNKVNYQRLKQGY